MVDSKSFIGNMVEVKMDRPMGSKHPKHGFIYISSKLWICSKYR